MIHHLLQHRLLRHHVFKRDLLREGGSFVVVGVAQLLVDWLVFVVLTLTGSPAAFGNLAGRICGAILGFWLNGRVTFAQAGVTRLGWPRFGRFLLVWIPLTLISTLLMSWAASALGLHLAWLAKPLVEALLAMLSFFLWRYLVYR